MLACIAKMWTTHWNAVIFVIQDEFLSHSFSDESSKGRSPPSSFTFLLFSSEMPASLTHRPYCCCCWSGRLKIRANAQILGPGLTTYRPRMWRSIILLPVVWQWLAITLNRCGAFSGAHDVQGHTEHWNSRPYTRSPGPGSPWWRSVALQLFKKMSCIVISARQSIDWPSTKCRFLFGSVWVIDASQCFVCFIYATPPRYWLW